METSFALTGKDYVIIAADTTAARSIVKMKTDEDKIKTLNPHLLMAYSGDSGRSFFLNLCFNSHLHSQGDTLQFAEYVERSIRLYGIRNVYQLRPSAAASWIRREMANSLRSNNPYEVNLLLGGYDVETNRPHLYWIDYLGTLTEVPFASHGYGGYFSLSLLDRYGFFIYIINLGFSIPCPKISQPGGIAGGRSGNTQTLHRSSLKETCC